jgi:Flp pilus assembly protein TadD
MPRRLPNRVGLVAWLWLLALLPACATYQGARLYGSGSGALERGDTARAVVDLERAAELVPHASEIHNHLGIAYAAQGQHADALYAFRRAVAIDCDNAAARQNLRAAEARASQLAEGARLDAATTLRLDEAPEFPLEATTPFP